MSVSHSPHGTMRSICDRNPFFFVRTCANSSLRPDRLTCLSLPIFYHTCLFSASFLCGIALDKLDVIKTGTAHDRLEMVGSRAVWREVLAVYAVKTTTDPDTPQEAATMDESKKALMKEIFWAMNEIGSRTETATTTQIKETDDGAGNIIEKEVEVTETVLHITMTHKTAEEMADAYHFTAPQRMQLAELLDGKNSDVECRPIRPWRRRQGDRSGGPFAAGQYRRRTLLGMVRLWKPGRLVRLFCVMVRLFCVMVRQRVRLSGTWRDPQIRKLRCGYPVVSNEGAMAGW